MDVTAPMISHAAILGFFGRVDMAVGGGGVEGLTGVGQQMVVYRPSECGSFEFVRWSVVLLRTDRSVGRHQDDQIDHLSNQPSHHPLITIKTFVVFQPAGTPVIRLV